jgi:ATP-dependent RNA helicase DDX27
VTLVGEADRKMLKAAIKHASGEDQVRHRTIPPDIVAKWTKRLELLKPEISAVLQDETEEKQVSMGIFGVSLRSLTSIRSDEQRWSSQRART